MDTEVKDTATLPNAEEQVEVKEVAEETAKDTASETAEEHKDGEKPKEAAENQPSKHENVDRRMRGLKRDLRTTNEKLVEEKIAKARLEAELETIKKYGLKPAEAQPDPDTEPAEPDINDFETVADYNKALVKFTKDYTKWNNRQTEKKIEEVKKTASAPVGETPQQKKARETGERIQSTLGKLADEFGEDAVEAITSMPLTEFSESMRDIILNKPDTSTKLIKAIADNPALGKKIAAMPVFDQVREIDKLEAAILTKRSTNAPPPASTVAGKGGAGQPDPNKMSDKEWKAWKLKQKLNSA